MNSTTYSPLVPEFDSAEQESSYGAWLNAKLSSSLEDLRPHVPHDRVMEKMRAMLDERKRARATG